MKKAKSIPTDPCTSDFFLPSKSVCEIDESKGQKQLPADGWKRTVLTVFTKY